MMKTYFFALFFVTSFFSAQTLKELMNKHIKEVNERKSVNREMLSEHLENNAQAEEWLYNFLPRLMEQELSDGAMTYLVYVSQISDKEKNDYAEKTDTLERDELLRKKITELNKFDINFTEWSKDYIEKDVPQLYEFIIDFKAIFDELKHDKTTSKSLKKTYAHLEFGKLMERLKNLNDIRDRLKGAYHEAKLLQVDEADEYAAKIYREITK